MHNLFSIVIPMLNLPQFYPFITNKSIKEVNLITFFKVLSVAKITHTPPWCPPSPVGLYKVTNTTTSGSDIGATPIKEVTYLLVFTPSSEVPVFPPTLYPFTCAFFPVPFSYNRFHHA